MAQKILFGAGKTGLQALQYYGHDNVFCFCDSYVTGKICGKQVITFDELRDIYKDYDIVICIANVKACAEVCRKLELYNIIYNLFQIESQNEASFVDIYKNSIWGGKRTFYSGNGSYDPVLIQPYMELLCKLIKQNPIETIVDLGCGDFYIMNQVLQRIKLKSYIGIDIVPELVAFNNTQYKNEVVSFKCLDITVADNQLPKADMIIIRQVLQHLSNDSIEKVLVKSKEYRYVLITEHIYCGEFLKANLDKPNGSCIRVAMGSGVFIEKEPFSVKHVINLLTIPYRENEYIRTSLIVNR